MNSKRLLAQIDRPALQVFLLTFPHLKPGCFEEMYPTLETLCNYGRIVSAVILLYILVQKHIKMNTIIVLTAVFGLWPFVGTMVWNSGGEKTAFVTMASFLSMVLIVAIYSDRAESLVSGLTLNFEWLVYANAYSVWKYYPNGMYIDQNYYFLGNRNGFITPLIIAVAFSYLCFKMGGSQIRPILVLLAGSYSIFKVESATCKLCLVTLLFGLFLLMSNITIPYEITFVGFVIGHVLVTQFGLAENNNLVSWIVQDVLLKRSDLTGRIAIWEACEEKIAIHPIIGWGTIVRVTANGTSTYSHNFIYDLLLKGGWIWVILMLAIFISVWLSVLKQRKGTMYGIMSVVFLATMMGSITESRLDHNFFLILALMHYAEKIDFVIENSMFVQALPIKLAFVRK